MDDDGPASDRTTRRLRVRWPWLALGAFALWCLGIAAVVALRGDEREPAPTAVASLEDARRAVVQVRATGQYAVPDDFVAGAPSPPASGSGFVVDDQGTVVTAAHVVAGAGEVRVEVEGAEGTRDVPAEVVGFSECQDLALLDIDEPDVAHLELRPAELTPGEEIFVAGYPEGDPEYTLTEGIVARARAGEDNGLAEAEVFETDAEVRPGSSGGPVLDGAGRALGLVFAEERGGLALAVSATTIDDLADRVAVDDPPPSLGASLLPLGERAGLWVRAVHAGGAADRIGLQAGDVLTELNNSPLGGETTLADYCSVLGETPTVGLTVLRAHEGRLFGGAVGEGYEEELSLQAEVLADDGVGYAPYFVPRHDTETVESDGLRVEVPVGWEHETLPDLVAAAPHLDVPDLLGSLEGGMYVERVPGGLSLPEFDRLAGDLVRASPLACEAEHARALDGPVDGYATIVGCGVVGIAVMSLRPPGSSDLGIVAVFGIAQAEDIALANDFLDGFRFV